MINKMRLLLVAGLLSTLLGCNAGGDYDGLKPVTENGFVQAVIEIPAGSNRKVVYDSERKKFVSEEEGDEAVVRFTGYPGNFGFIPSTTVTGDQGKTENIDILVLSEPQEVGNVVEVMPLGMMVLLENERKRYKVIAVPVYRSERTVLANGLQDLEPELVYSLELWFLNSEGPKNLKLLGWESRERTMAFIWDHTKT